MNRVDNFSNAVAVPFNIKDSRFGLRRMTNNLNESPSIFSYASPGSGANGEHQS